MEATQLWDFQRKKVNPENPEEAIPYLHRRGAQFVLCLQNKRPITKGWQKIRPPLPNVLRHLSNDLPLGLIPASISTSAVDVDHGDPTRLIEAYPPLAKLDSRRKGGVHLYFWDRESRRNRKFSALDCAGEIRSGSGYLLLWDGQAWKLSEGLRTPPADAVPFPADLFEAAGVELDPVALHDSTFSRNPLRRPVPGRPTDLSLERIYPGQRHVTLFDTTRFFSYAEPLGKDFTAWSERVLAFALEQNQRFPVPFPEHPGDDQAAVKRLADDVAGWVWSGGGPIDHSPQAQRRRGEKSGRVRRLKVKDRSLEMVNSYLSGNSLREVAARFALSYNATRHVISRDASLYLRGPGQPKKNEP